MSEHEPLPPLDDSTREVLERASRAIPSVPAGARDRVLARVEGVLWPTGGGGPPSGSPGLSSRPVAAGVSALRRVWPLLASFAVGGAVGAAGMRAYAPAPRERIVYRDRPAALSSAPPSRATPPLVEVSSLPLASPAPAEPSLGRSTPSAVAASSTAADVQDVAAERKLLDVARHALDAEDGAAALAAANVHEHRYPNGALVQEREAMAIRALMLLGRTDEARARAQRFRARFPDSLLLPAIESEVTTSPSP